MRGVGVQPKETNILTDSIPSTAGEPGHETVVAGGNRGLAPDNRFVVPGRSRRDRTYQCVDSLTRVCQRSLD